LIQSPSCIREVFSGDCSIGFFSFLNQVIISHHGVSENKNAKPNPLWILLPMPLTCLKCKSGNQKLSSRASWAPAK
jgi:hypothetical protein